MTDKYHPFDMYQTDDSDEYNFFMSMMHEKVHVWEQAGFMGNGHDWTRMINSLISHQIPEVKGNIDFDSEADSSTMYSTDLSSLEKVSSLVSDIYQDNKQFEQAIKQYGHYS
jgi:hypothetical protein